MKWEDCQGFENSPSEAYILLQARAFEREIIKYHGHSLLVSLSLPLYMYMNIPISYSILFFSSPNLSEQILAQFVILVVPGRNTSINKLFSRFPKLQLSIVCLFVKGHLLTDSKCPPIHCHPLEPNSCSSIFIICSHEHAPVCIVFSWQLMTQTATLWISSTLAQPTAPWLKGRRTPALAHHDFRVSITPRWLWTQVWRSFGGSNLIQTWLEHTGKHTISSTNIPNTLDILR